MTHGPFVIGRDHHHSSIIIHQSYITGSLLGGCGDTMKANADGRLMALVGDRNSNEDAADGPTAIVESAIKGHKVVVFSKSFCPFCTKVKDLFDSLNIQYEGALFILSCQFWRMAIWRPFLNDLNDVKTVF